METSTNFEAARKSGFEKIKVEVDRRRTETRDNWVYGRFYVGNKSYLGIHIARTGKTISAIYPAI